MWNGDFCLQSMGQMVAIDKISSLQKKEECT